MSALLFTKAFIGLLYLAGGCLLQPGFLWIIPDKPIQVPVSSSIVMNFTVHPPVPVMCGYMPCFKEWKTVPYFKSPSYHTEGMPAYHGTDSYDHGVNLLIVGMGIIVVAALLDLLLVHCRTPEDDHSDYPQSDLYEPMTAPSGSISKPDLPWFRSLPMRTFGPFCTLVGSMVIMAGCIIFLPKYALGGANNAPVEWHGKSSVDWGNMCFQIGAVIQFSGAMSGVVTMVFAIVACSKAGRSTVQFYFWIMAFVCFMATSVLFFINPFFSNAKCVDAGNVRMVASVSLFCGIIIIAGITAVEVYTGLTGTDAKENKQDQEGYPAAQHKIQV